MARIVRQPCLEVVLHAAVARLIFQAQQPYAGLTFDRRASVVKGAG
jgi:hypothetical protein